MKTSHKDFERFKKEFCRWQTRFGLTDWQVYFEHGKTDECYAEIFVNHEGRVATAVFADKLNDQSMTKIGYDPVHTGRHEAMELLISPLKELACRRAVSGLEINAAAHAIIRRLENLFDR